MAYTTPTTFVTGELVTAAKLNEQVRDNISYLYSEVKKVRTLELPQYYGTVPDNLYQGISVANIVSVGGTISTYPRPYDYGYSYPDGGETGVGWALSIPTDFYDNPKIVYEYIYSSGTAGTAVFGVRTAAFPVGSTSRLSAFTSLNYGTIAGTAGTAYPTNAATISITGYTFVAGDKTVIALARFTSDAADTCTSAIQVTSVKMVYDQI